MTLAEVEELSQCIAEFGNARYHQGVTHVRFLQGDTTLEHNALEKSRDYVEAIHSDLLKRLLEFLREE